jgi:hypothetical protein
MPMVNTVLSLFLTPLAFWQEPVFEKGLEITSDSLQIHTPTLDHNYNNSLTVGVPVKFPPLGRGIDGATALLFLRRLPSGH